MMVSALGLPSSHMASELLATSASPLESLKYQWELVHIPMVELNSVRNCSGRIVNRLPAHLYVFV